jgi:hypothetical protein
MSMKKTIIALIGVLALETAAAEWRPSESLLRAVKEVESNDGRFLYGDEGRSLGAFQMSRGAWKDVNAWRRARGLKTYDYGSHALNSYINRVYAADYLSMIHSELSKQLRRPPVIAEIYAAYNMGLGNFAECDYRLANVNPVTAKKAKAIHNLVHRAG